MDYLNYLAEMGQAHIHPGGAGATQWLLHHLDLQTGERVLEIGCGTGASLLACLQKAEVQLVGIDPRLHMIRAAKRRLKTLPPGKNIQLMHAPFPPAQHSLGLFDKAYSESVLCFQDEATWRHMAGEVFEVLRPGGIYAAVETVWKEPVDPAYVAEKIPAIQNTFGVTLSTPMPWSWRDWVDAFNTCGFEILSQDRWEDCAFDWEGKDEMKRSWTLQLRKFWKALWFWRWEMFYRRQLQQFEGMNSLVETRFFLLKRTS